MTRKRRMGIVVLMLLITVGSLAAYVWFDPDRAVGPVYDEAQLRAAQRNLLASERFRNWLIAAKFNPRANSGDGLVQTHNKLPETRGVYWTPELIVVAIRKDILFEGQPLQQAFLEFSHQRMSRWSEPIEHLGNMELWMWLGSRTPQRFTFSYDFGDGKLHWAWIDSCASSAPGGGRAWMSVITPPTNWPLGIGGGGTVEGPYYRPWLDPASDLGVLVGGVYIDDTWNRQAYLVDPDAPR